jgi:hypothetical protein
MAERPRLVKVDPEMRRWCEPLEDELSTWPQVTSKPMFGMQAFYRSSHIFAALPRTRAAETPFSILIKLPGARAGRLHTASGPGAGWMAFTMEGEGDVSEALKWLGKAYEMAVKPAAPVTRPRTS